MQPPTGRVRVRGTAGVRRPKPRGPAPEDTVELAPQPIERRVRPADREECHRLPDVTQAVFERLRRAGVGARTQVPSRVPTGDHPARRRDQREREALDEALSSLTAGELEDALGHFRRLYAELPGSMRLAAFIDAIESVRGYDDRAHTPPLGVPVRPASGEPILDTFEHVLEEAVAYGRCPSCFSMVEKNPDVCFACGFALSR